MADSRLKELRGAVDPTQPLPLYHQVRQRLERWIERHLEPGAELPTEAELMEAFDVSRVTVRQAISELLADGALFRPKPRSRLRRATPRVHQELRRLPGFFRDDVLAAGMSPAVDVISSGVVRDERVAELLHVHADADLVKLLRLHSGSGQPMALQASYLPATLFPGILDHDVAGSLFTLTDEVYGQRITGARQRVYAREARAEEAQLLHVPQRAPVLVVERVSFSKAGVPLEYFRCCLRADSYDFTVALGDLAERAPHRRGSEEGQGPEGMAEVGAPAAASRS